MYRSTDDARTFELVRGEGTDPFVPGFHFNCTVSRPAPDPRPSPLALFNQRAQDEGTAWSVLELPAPSHGMPAGVYYFADRTIWRSTDSGRYWRPYSTSPLRSSAGSPARFRLNSPRGG